MMNDATQTGGPSGTGGDVLFLVSCARKKQSVAAAARDLYLSTWFKAAREYVEAYGVRWFVLSALRGLVEADCIIAPYEKTLNRLSADERRAWASCVLRQLQPLLSERTRI